MTTKQTAAVDTLRAGLEARGIDVAGMTTSEEGKTIVVAVAEGFPKVIIGLHGGVKLPEIRSYEENGKDKTAMTAAINGDMLLAKQTERDTKKKNEDKVAEEEEEAAVAEAVAEEEEESPEQESQVRQMTKAERKAARKAAKQAEAAA